MSSAEPTPNETWRDNAYDPAHCPACDYLRTGLPEPTTCPECGFPLSAELHAYGARFHRSMKAAGWTVWIPLAIAGVLALGQLWQYSVTRRNVHAIVTVIIVLCGAMPLLVRKFRSHRFLAIDGENLYIVRRFGKRETLPLAEISDVALPLRGTWVRLRFCDRELRLSNAVFFARRIADAESFMRALRRATERVRRHDNDHSPF